MAIAPKPARTDDRRETRKHLPGTGFLELCDHLLELATTMETDAIFQWWSTFDRFLQRLGKTRTELKVLIWEVEHVRSPRIVINNGRRKYGTRGELERDLDET